MQMVAVRKQQQLAQSTKLSKGKTMKKIILIVLLFTVPLWAGREPLKVPSYNVTHKNAIEVSPGNYSGYPTLQSASDHLGSISGLTDTNRATLILDTGSYTVTSGLTLSQYVDVVGVGMVTLTDGGSGSTGIIIPPSLAADETGVTNYLVNLNVNGYMAIDGRLAYDNTYITNVVVMNCNLYGRQDCVYMGNVSGGVGNNKNLTVYNSSLYSEWDTVSVLAGTHYFYGCSIVAENTTNSRCSSIFVANTAATTMTANFYDCRLYAKDDQSATEGTDVNAVAYGVYGPGAGTINIHGGSVEVIAIPKGAGTTTGNGIHCAKNTLAVNLFGTNFIGCSSYDIKRTAGAVYAKNCEYDIAKLSGVVYGVDVGIACTSATDMANYPNGSIFTNYGDTDGVAFTAPAAVVGARFSVDDVVNTAGADITITCAGSDTFIDPDDGTTTYTVYTHTADVYGSVGFRCVTDGEWQMDWSIGANP